MPDIFVPVDTSAEVKQKVRTNKITISNPFNGSKSMSFRNEKITLVDNVETGRDRAPNTTRSFDDVAAEMITITDPVTSQEITISVAGVATAIEEAYVAWWYEDNPAE